MSKRAFTGIPNPAPMSQMDKAAIVRLVADPAVTKNLTFSIGAIHITPAKLSTIGNLISLGTIDTYWFDRNDVAIYSGLELTTNRFTGTTTSDPSRNVLFLPRSVLHPPTSPQGLSYYNQVTGLIVHEMVHAIVDYEKLLANRVDAEAACYTAQYIVILSLDPSFTVPASWNGYHHAAFDVAKAVIQHQQPYSVQVGKLRDAIRNDVGGYQDATTTLDPKTGRRVDQTAQFDGIAPR